MSSDSPAAALPDRLPGQPPSGYLDAVGGQPLTDATRRAWLAAADQAWSDPARLHHAGRRAGLVLDTARQSIATSLRIDRDEAYWTSSGPTAVATALQGLLRNGGRVAASGVESLAVLSPAKSLAAEVDLIAVDRHGRINLDDLDRALADQPAVLAVQAANPEVGTRQPLAQVHERAQRAGVPLLVHAVQVIGRDPVPDHWDVLAASARDWAGPAGVGVLAVRRHLAWTPEENPDRGWVGGFPDIPAAVAAATALEQLLPLSEVEAERHRGLTHLIRDQLPVIVDGVQVVGTPEDRLPHIVTFTCAGVMGETVVDELARRGYSVASGSACTSDVRMPSQVLAAMGIAADASVRVSLPLGCTEETVYGFLAVLPGAVRAARSTLA
jgi:cysteine desulfurase